MTATPFATETAVPQPCANLSTGDVAMWFLALGDSYTIGESVAEAERWPVQLAALLRAQGVMIADPVIVARTGWTTDELATGIAQAQPQGPFDLVSLLIGVNNQYRGRAIEEYREQFANLLAQAIDFAGGDSRRVFVLSIPDWSVTPFAQRQRGNTGQIAAEIDAFNAVNLEESAKQGVLYVDVTPISREAAQDSALLAADGLHPSGVMYGRWAALALPQLCTQLAGD
ncbi:MAG: SGNH/GDSL hydrolase family protein [Ardenticatenaceae bacterium]|nr:SGNH/GDSL hydrolase family protein [Ardenticatenaceae bacterium]